MDRRSDSRPVIRYVMLALAGVHLFNGLYMLIDPSGFYENVATFGIQNDHFMRDISSFVLAFAMLLAIAAMRPSWRPAAIAYGLIQYAIHIVNHIFDIDQASPESLGVTNVITLTIGLAVLIWLAFAVRAERSIIDGPADGRQL